MTRAKRMKAVGDPLRVRTVLLMCFGPGPGTDRTWTAKELAAELGRDANVLYHHLGLLEDAGFVVEDGVRAVGGRRERAYRGVPDVMVISDPDDPEGWATYMTSILEGAKWGIETAVHSRLASAAQGEEPMVATVNAPGFSTTHEETISFRDDLMDLIQTYRKRAKDLWPAEAVEAGIAPEGFRYLTCLWALWESEIPYHLFTDMPGAIPNAAG